MTCANVLVGLGENREGMETMRLSVSLKAVVYFDLFQSTLPRRERLCDCVVCPVRINFNPRSREGSDQHEKERILAALAFQSTLP